MLGCVPASALDKKRTRQIGSSLPAESAAIFGSLAEIDPQVQKGEDESRAKHHPLNRQKRPENAGVVELPHPQPFFQITGDTYQDSKK